MLRKLLLSTFYSLIVFCVLSYISVMASILLSSEGPYARPITNIGFPLKYYYQFWTEESASPQWGWDGNSFLIDLIATWVCCTAFYFAFKRNRKAAVKQEDI